MLEFALDTSVFTLLGTTHHSVWREFNGIPGHAFSFQS